MKILYVASEMSPLFKLGGLGDVAGSLPKELHNLGVDMTVALPFFEPVKLKIKNKNLADAKTLISRKLEIEKLKNTIKNEKLICEFKGIDEIVDIYETKVPGSEVPLLLFDNPKYLSVYVSPNEFGDSPSIIERFSFFSEAVTRYLTESDFDLVHLNDWHTSFVATLLKVKSHPPIRRAKIRTLLTIHNLSYQGISGLDLLHDLGLEGDELKSLQWDIQNGDIDILMQGIINADFVNTVSPSYAREIMTPEFGEGLWEVLKGREGVVAGILNGIDTDYWNPQTDKLLGFNYGGDAWKNGKFVNKLNLCREYNFDPKMPLISFIVRLTSQKGIDILIEALGKGKFVKPFNLFVLGTGDYENRIKNLKLKIKNQVKVELKFDEPLAHRLYAASDFFLVPSKFEPCGLTQMIAMRYGTIPVVRFVGGLKDTVLNGVNGIVFNAYSASALTEAINRALNLYNTDAFDKMTENGMKEDFSWKNSAQKYKELYEKILNF